VWGYEPTAEAGREFVATRREAISARFDGIFSNNVIEHFRDPIAQFKEFHSLLNERGMMAHSSPCYEYRYSFTRFHTLFLLGRSPDVLAERTGFKVINRIQEGEYIPYVFSRV
jgi:2-polyprenyl-3-methyl-5-hydroxy-6-metoxy-1,4-benzoquinol methylase